MFVLADERPEHQSFCRNALNIYPRKLRKAWERQFYSGTGQAPVRVRSAEEMRQRVGSTPGTIGHLRGNETGDSVKVLQIR